MEQLSSADDTLDRLLEEQDICMLLQNCKRQYAGTARLGIEAIEWKVKGLSGAEIAKCMGSSRILWVRGSPELPDG